MEPNYLQKYEQPKRKLNKAKVGVILLLLLALICLISWVASKEQKQELESKTTENKEIESHIEKPERTKETIKIPAYTDEAVAKLKNIYTSEEKRVFLTFDDGPSPNVTPLILDVLKQNEIKATFFMLGCRVDTYPSIAKRVYEEGHYLANHGYYHIYSKIYESPETVLTEYQQCEYAIGQAIGIPEYTTRLFRFPGGKAGGTYAEIKQEATKVLDENNIAYIDWNCLTQDSAGKHSKEELLGFLKSTSEGKNNLVVLMHDAGDKILTYEMLQEGIDYLKEQGYRFCSFYDIMGEMEIERQ